MLDIIERADPSVLYSLDSSTDRSAHSSELERQRNSLSRRMVAQFMEDMNLQEDFDDLRLSPTLHLRQSHEENTL